VSSSIRRGGWSTISSKEYSYSEIAPQRAFDDAVAKPHWTLMIDFISGKHEQAWEECISVYGFLPPRLGLLASGRDCAIA
jgi:hypothetical protein